MSKKRFFLMFIAASVSAFLGCFVSNQLYLSANAVANDNGKQQSIQPLEHKLPPEFKVVEANQFRLVDLEGNCLAKLTIEEEENKFLEMVLGPTKTSKTSKTYHAVLEMGTGYRSMRMTKDEVEFRAGSTQASLASGNLFLKDKSFIKIYADNMLRGGTSIEIYDEDGNKRAALGSVNLNVIATGEIQNRPESSLVLFGKDGKVVYSAP
jgi:hypothetical protein